MFKSSLVSSAFTAIVASLTDRDAARYSHHDHLVKPAKRQPRSLGKPKQQKAGGLFSASDIQFYLQRMSNHERQLWNRAKRPTSKAWFEAHLPVAIKADRKRALAA